MKRSAPYILLLAFCFSMICQPVFVSASGIVVEKPETIVQYQLGTMRMDVEEAHKKELTEILDGLEEVVLMEEKGELSRGDDFISILLIRENGDKDKFFFFQDQGQWYLETEDGTVYENADFFTEIMEVEEIEAKAILTTELCKGLLKGPSIEDEEAEQLAAYAKEEGFYPEEQEIDERMKKYLADFQESPDYEECEKLCQEEGTTVEEVVKKNEAVFIRMMLLNEFDKQRRVEYMEGEDTIEGKSYSDFTFYEKAYLDTYVYQK